jgi:hypothetical protein
METFKKRQKETKRLERQRDKAARRIQKKLAPPPVLDEYGNPVEENPTAPDGSPIATDENPGENPTATNAGAPDVEPKTGA